MRIEDHAGERRELAPSVILVESGPSLVVRQGLWEVIVATLAIDQDPGLRSLARDRIVDMSLCTQAGRGLAALLDAQGCFLRARPTVLSPDEILAVFRPLRSALYAAYYAHPLWQDLRS